MKMMLNKTNFWVSWCLVAIFCCTNSFAVTINDDGNNSQNSDSQSISVVAYWKKGDKKKLEVVKGRTEMVNGQVVDQKQLTSKVELSVLEATKKGYVVQWQYMDSNKNY